MVIVERCPFCNESNFELVSTQTYRDIYLDLIRPSLNSEIRNWLRCLVCGGLFRSPKLDADEQHLLYRRYREASFRTESPDEYFDRITTFDDGHSENYHKVSWLLNKGRKLLLSKTKKILDIGCGGGVLIKKLKTMFPELELYGVEPNVDYSELARRRSGAEEIKTSYFSRKLFDLKFDGIVSSDVMEHVDNPREFLRDIKHSLKVRGFLFIEVPSPRNFEELAFDHDMFNVAHHVFFTEEILYQMLGEAGFSNIIVQDVKNISGVWKLKSIGYS